MLRILAVSVCLLIAGGVVLDLTNVTGDFFEEHQFIASVLAEGLFLLFGLLAIDRLRDLSDRRRWKQAVRAVVRDLYTDLDESLREIVFMALSPSEPTREDLDAALGLQQRQATLLKNRVVEMRALLSARSGLAQLYPLFEHAVDAFSWVPMGARAGAILLATQARRASDALDALADGLRRWDTDALVEPRSAGREFLVPAREELLRALEDRARAELSEQTRS